MIRLNIMSGSSMQVRLTCASRLIGCQYTSRFAAGFSLLGDDLCAFTVELGRVVYSEFVRPAVVRP